MVDELTPAMLHIALALTAGPRHGYALMSEVNQLSRGQLKLGPGTLYRSLQRMVSAEMIQELPEPASALVGADARRRRYLLTETGRAALQAEAARLAWLVQLASERGVLPLQQHQRHKDSPSEKE